MPDVFKSWHEQNVDGEKRKNWAYKGKTAHNYNYNYIIKTKINFKKQALTTND